MINPLQDFYELFPVRFRNIMIKMRLKADY